MILWTFKFITILVLSSRATSNGIYSSHFATHNEKLLDWSKPFLKVKWLKLMSPKPIVIKTQLKYQLFTQLTIDMHLVHGILKDPLASTYSSFDIIPEQATNHNTELVPIKFWSRKANNKKDYFSQYALPIQKLKHNNTQLLDNMYYKQYKSIDKGNKRSSKKPKSLITTIIFNRLTVTINDVRSFNNRVHSW